MGERWEMPNIVAAEMNGYSVTLSTGRPGYNDPTIKVSALGAGEAETLARSVKNKLNACSGLTLPDDVEQGAVTEVVVLANELLEALDHGIAPVNAGFQDRLSNALAALGIKP